MERVLIVDDHPDSADIMAALIERMGHAVLYCTTGAAALRQAPTFQPTVAFLDLLMPHPNGYELAAMLRTIFPQLRLFAMSGMPTDKWQTETGLFERFLLKPVLSRTIIELIGERHGA